MAAPVAVTNAVSALRNAENGALSRSAANETSLYTGSGRETPGKAKVKGKKKGMFVVALILSIMIGGGAWLGSSNTLLGPMMSANLTSVADLQYTSYHTRVVKTINSILKNTEKSVTVPATEVPSKLGDNLKNYDIETNTKSFTWNGNTIDSNNFETTFYNNPEFREDFMNGKQGRAANFYDTGANKTLQKDGISRNAFSGYKQTGDVSTDTESFNSTMRSKFDNGSTSIRSYTEGEEEYTTKNNKGEDVTVRDDIKIDDADSAKVSSNDIEVAKTSARSMIDTVAKRVGQAGSLACAVMQMGTMISAAVAANEIYASVKYFMLIMENISKMMAGQGDTSAYHATMNLLSTGATSEISDFNNISGTITSESSQPSIGTIQNTGSPLEDPGLQMGLSGAKGNKNTGKNYSLERVALALGGTLTMGRNATLACQGADAANSLISIGVTLATAGTAGIVATVVNQFISANTLKTIAIGVIFGFLVPTLATSFFTNLFDTTKGMSIGALITKGAVASLANQIGKQNSSLTISSGEEVLAFNKQTNTVLALDAEVDRLTHSPFDITNKNTFLGSIAYSLLPAVTATNATSAFTSLAKTTSTSIASITGRASADGEGSSYMTTFGDCPLLESIGAVGDIYCNPITVTDSDTINLDPEDATYVQVISNNTDCTSESCTIKNDSDLAKYITFCDGRLSPYGIADQNILNAASKGNVILNSIPLIGDVVGLIDDINAAANTDWATGQKCGNTDLNRDFWESKGKYFQRYVEDQRIYEQIGTYGDNGKSPVSQYKEEYEAKNPVDDSYAGYIARISGMTKENAEDMLAFAEYYQYLDNYDATIRIALDNAALLTQSSAEIVAKISEQQTPDFRNSEKGIYTDSKVFFSAQHIIYADVRNRSYAI